jgi:hypothetical protein
LPFSILRIHTFRLGILLQFSKEKMLVKSCIAFSLLTRLQLKEKFLSVSALRDADSCSSNSSLYIIQNLAIFEIAIISMVTKHSFN